MSRKRVNDIAKEQGISAKDLLLKLQAAGIDAAAPSATVDEASALEALGNGAGDGNGAAKPRPEGEGVHKQRPTSRSPWMRTRTEPGRRMGRGPRPRRRPRSPRHSARAPTALRRLRPRGAKADAAALGG